ncbi:MAG: hypothetical protein KatS3mg126_2227 [Lysobacteraceae bacterium]|nr:MAG: hypothetical protein KatS3mg126_2227 [Xanthomonadaceae bacterium]
MQTAPEFPAQLEWVNGDPVLMGAQRGRVVALVFWHAASAYCHNLLADLELIATRHADGLTVVAVHTPKFDAERDPRIPLKAINRLGSRLPVAHDRLFLLWQHYEVRAWPTVVLIDPEGRVDGRFVGDDQGSAIERGILGLLERTGAEARQFGPPVQGFRPEPRTPLSFPSGIVVGTHRLYVADTGHHRVLECSHDGRVLRSFGSGNPGYVDGHANESSLSRPQGLHLGREGLFIADTGNHSVRRVNLLSGEVSTVIGTGQRRQPEQGLGSTPTTTALDSPFAVTGSREKIWVSLAAGNQIVELDQMEQRMRILVGNGRLGLADGGGEHAMLAQPAGLALWQQSLLVADSAASAIRSVHLAGGQVHTLTGRGLFEFGSEDGPRQAALLQHPQGVALDAEKSVLWIADTYNNQIRYLRLDGGQLHSQVLEWVLHEPAAVALGANALWIANTNAHEVLRYDFMTRQIERLPIGE